MSLYSVLVQALLLLCARVMQHGIKWSRRIHPHFTCQKRNDVAGHGGAQVQFQPPGLPAHLNIHLNLHLNLHLQLHLHLSLHLSLYLPLYLGQLPSGNNMTSTVHQTMRAVRGDFCMSMTGSVPQTTTSL